MTNKPILAKFMPFSILAKAPLKPGLIESFGDKSVSCILNLQWFEICVHGSPADGWHSARISGCGRRRCALRRAGRRRSWRTTRPGGTLRWWAVAPWGTPPCSPCSACCGAAVLQTGTPPSRPATMSSAISINWPRRYPFPIAHAHALQNETWAYTASCPTCPSPCYTSLQEALEGHALALHTYSNP